MNISTFPAIVLQTSSGYVSYVANSEQLPPGGRERPSNGARRRHRCLPCPASNSTVVPTPTFTNPDASVRLDIPGMQGPLMVEILPESLGKGYWSRDLSTSGSFQCCSGMLKPLSIPGLRFRSYTMLGPIGGGLTGCGMMASQIPPLSNIV